MKPRARVAICGAGPAGTTLALELIDRGVDPADLVLLDRCRFPRPKLCGGAVTWRGTAALARRLPASTHRRVAAGLQFRSPFGVFDVREPGPQWVFDRAALDASLLDRCRAAGVTVREESPVKSVEPAGCGWRVRTAGASERFDWVVGADGAQGIVRRCSGLRGGRAGRLIEVEADAAPGDASTPHDTLLFDFSPILDGIAGYAWRFPHPEAGRGPRWKVGLMDAHGRVPAGDLKRWLRGWMQRQDLRIGDARIAGWTEHYADAGTLGHAPGLLLVGEAFGIDALLGEGIAPSIANAAYAAARLRGALDRTTDRVRAYETGFFATAEGLNLWFQARLADCLYGAGGRRWLHRMFTSPELRAAGAEGIVAYGRMARHAPALAAARLWRWLARPMGGAPSVEAS